MRAGKVTVTIPEELLEQIHPEVLRLGMSAYVTDALRTNADHDGLTDVVRWLEDEYGPVTEEQLDAARAEMDEIDAEHVRRRGAADQLTGPPRTCVLDREALSLAVQGHEGMLGRMKLAASDGTTVLTSPLTLVEAYDGRITERRWDWVLSRVGVARVGKDEARQARRLLADAGLHGHKYAIDAVLAAIARRQQGQVTVFTSDADDLEKLLPETVLVRGV